MGDILNYAEEYGVPPPVWEEYESSDAFWAAYNTWYAGLSDFAVQRIREEETARIAEEAERLQSGEEAARQEEAGQAAEEAVAQLPETGEDRIPIGSYIDAAGNVWSPAGELLSGDGDMMDSYVDPAGHLWTMERSAPMEQQPLVEGDVETGDPAIDTALLFLDLFEQLTGEDGTVSDVDGIQEVVDHPLMTTSFQEYTVTEGLLLLLLLSLFVAACAKMLKEGFSWLR